MAVEFRGVSFSYEHGLVLSDVTLSVGTDDFVVLLGTNGSGKTTLLKVGIGLLEPQAGKVRLFGDPASEAHARARVGYVPQRTAISSRVPATVTEVVLAGRAGRKLFGAFTRPDRDAALHALDRVGLADVANRRIGELSGGQQQRVLIARALANDPDLLVLDEPTAGVDRTSQTQFADLLADLHEKGAAVLIVAHDLGAVGGHVSRVLLLHQGHIDEVPPKEARMHVGLFVEDHPR